ncbi:MAG: autotransporter outer membrane beta-barrel domain-containing protein [Thermodesulfobacteriota bacterium]|nr:autotransporter outer membrane beta-barrel domain-containing protein [Thermodesulfobacteriota bacterium]
MTNRALAIELGLVQERGGIVGRWIERLVEMPSVWMLLNCLCFLFLCSSVYAEDRGPLVPKHTFGIGVGASCFEYAEDAPLGKVEIDGPMYEVVGDYTYHDHVMLSASVNYSVGDHDYEGFVYATHPDGGGEWSPLKSDHDTEVVEGRGLIGYDYVFRGRYLVTPFLGIGYRYWNDDNEEAFGTEREIAYWYSPIGLMTQGPLSNTWNWGMTLEYDLFWDGDVDSGLRDAPTIHLDSGYGVRFSLCLMTPLTEDIDLSFETYITYWDIERAREPIYTVPGVGSVWAVEPENDTTTYGLRMSVRF